MNRCSERAFAMCPNRHLCGTIHEATFTDNSDCAEFNKKVDSMPITNADRIRAMSDEELAQFLTDNGNKHLTDIGWKMYYKHNWEWLKQPAEVDHE